MIIRKQWNHNKIAILGLILLFVLLLSSAFADEVNYLYDDNGRLARAVKGTEGITYQYDEVGNLLSIAKSIISASPPVLNSINPDVLFIGSTTLTAITGQNLFTTKEVSSTNPFLSIKIRSVTDTEIKLEIIVSASALPGAVNLTVTTLYGSASIQTTLISSKLSFSPGQIALTPGDSGDITASISPSIGRDLTIMINNSNPTIVSTPQSVTIPSSGTTTFPVTALKEGIATISSGDINTVVFVTKSFTSVAEGEIIIVNKAGFVSVSIEPPLGSVTAALPVSIYISAPAAVDAASVSLPVSVVISKGEITDASAVSLPVSISIESTGDTSTVSLPVSVYVEPLSGNATISSLLVSVFMQQSETSSLASLPVSVYVEHLSGDTTVSSLLVSVFMQQSETSSLASLPVSIYIQPAVTDGMTVSAIVSIGRCPNLPVRVVGTSTNYYSTLQEAYNAAPDGTIIQSQAGTFIENLNINLNKSVTLKGGHDCDFTIIGGKTTLKGDLTVNNGILKIEDFIVD